MESISFAWIMNEQMMLFNVWLWLTFAKPQTTTILHHIWTLNAVLASGLWLLITDYSFKLIIYKFSENSLSIIVFVFCNFNEHVTSNSVLPLPGNTITNNVWLPLGYFQQVIHPPIWFNQWLWLHLTYVRPSAVF